MHRIENKIARICWNSEGWRFPSGSKGKSKDSLSHEAGTGYGHEEWLFDKSKNIDGYHYAFLQPLHLKKSDHHVGRTYNISLYTIVNSKWYFVGEIVSAECLSKDESRKAYKVYKKNDWLKQMSRQLKIAGADCRAFNKTLPDIFFNVRFRFDDVTRPDDLEAISGKDSNIPNPRYKLFTRKKDFLFETVKVDDESEGKLKNTDKRIVTYKGTSEYDPYHDKMQNAIWKLLKKPPYAYKIVQIEKDRVDIKAKTQNNKWHYFEIKTLSPKQSIREAFGQLMEYVYWPDSDKAEKLIIVADNQPDKEAQKYLNHIRKKFSIPVTFRHYDPEKNILSEDY